MKSTCTCRTTERGTQLTVHVPVLVVLVLAVACATATNVTCCNRSATDSTSQTVTSSGRSRTPSLTTSGSMSGTGTSSLTRESSSLSKSPSPSMASLSTSPSATQSFTQTLSPTRLSATESRTVSSSPTVSLALTPTGTLLLTESRTASITNDTLIPFVSVVLPSDTGKLSERDLATKPSGSNETTVVFRLVHSIWRCQWFNRSGVDPTVLRSLLVPLPLNETEAPLMIVYMNRNVNVTNIGNVRTNSSSSSMAEEDRRRRESSPFLSMLDNLLPLTPFDWFSCTAHDITFRFHRYRQIDLTLNERIGFAFNPLDAVEQRTVDGHPVNLNSIRMPSFVFIANKSSPAVKLPWALINKFKEVALYSALSSAVLGSPFSALLAPRTLMLLQFADCEDDDGILLLQSPTGVALPFETRPALQSAAGACLLNTAIVLLSLLMHFVFVLVYSSRCGVPLRIAKGVLCFPSLQLAPMFFFFPTTLAFAIALLRRTDLTGSSILGVVVVGFSIGLIVFVTVLTSNKWIFAAVYRRHYDLRQRRAAVTAPRATRQKAMFFLSFPNVLFRGYGVWMDKGSLEEDDHQQSDGKEKEEKDKKTESPSSSDGDETPRGVLQSVPVPTHDEMDALPVKQRRHYRLLMTQQEHQVHIDELQEELTRSHHRVQFSLAVDNNWFVRSYFLCFGLFAEGRQWFAGVECMVSFALALLDGWGPTSTRECWYVSFAVTVVLSVYFLSLLLFRPYASQAVAISTLLAAAMQLFVSLGITLAHAVEMTELLPAVSYVAVGAMGFLAVKALIDAVAFLLWLYSKLRYRESKRRERTAYQMRQRATVQHKENELKRSLLAGPSGAGGSNSPPRSHLGSKPIDLPPPLPQQPSLHVHLSPHEGEEGGVEKKARGPFPFEVVQWEEMNPMFLEEQLPSGSPRQLEHLGLSTTTTKKKRKKECSPLSPRAHSTRDEGKLL